MGGKPDEDALALRDVVAPSSASGGARGSTCLPESRLASGITEPCSSSIGSEATGLGGSSAAGKLRARGASVDEDGASSSGGRAAAAGGAIEANGLPDPLS